MKLIPFFSAFAAAQRIETSKMREFNSGVRQAANQISSGARSDGNALLISQMLEFYLITVHGLEANKVEMMLSYGCYCQLLTNRKIGIGEPVDEFDAICRRYQQCTSCVAMDEAGKTINNGNGPEECNWESGRYEISFVQGQIRVDCENNNTKCGVNLCKCDEQLAFEMAENVDLFNAKNSVQRGFEFAETCLPQGTGPATGELKCCGDYPSRIPYRDNGKRQCCVDKVYSTDSKQCCKDGNIVGLDKSC